MNRRVAALAVVLLVGGLLADGGESSERDASQQPQGATLRIRRCAHPAGIDPEDVEATNLNAEFEDGLLEITVRDAVLAADSTPVAQGVLCT